MDTLEPLIVSSTKSASPIFELTEEGTFVAKKSQVAVTYGTDVDLGTVQEEVVFELTLQIAALQKHSGYSNGIYLNGSNSAGPFIFRMDYESGSLMNYFCYDSGVNGKYTYARVYTNANSAYFANKTTMLFKLEKSQKRFTVFKNGGQVGTGTFSGPTDYHGAWKPIIGGTHSNHNLPNLLTVDDQIFLSETHLYFDGVKQW